MKNIKKLCSMFILFFIICLVGLFFIGCARNKKERIVMGLDVRVMPMGYIGGNGEIVGFDVDLAREVCNKLGKELVFKPINWEEKEKELNNGNVDFIWNALSYSEERADKMELSKAYMKNSQIVVFNKDLDIKNLADLKNYNVCVQKGSTAEEFLEKHKISTDFKNFKKVEDMNTCLNEVSAKTCDAAVVDEVVYKSFVKEHKDEQHLATIENILTNEEFVIGFKKGNARLKKRFEKELQNLVNSHKAEEISKKWFGENLVFCKEVENVK